MAYSINKSAMLGAFVAVMVVVFDEVALGTENGDLGAATRLVDDLSLSIIGPSSLVEQM